VLCGSLAMDVLGRMDLHCKTKEGEAQCLLARIQMLEILGLGWKDECRSKQPRKRRPNFTYVAIEATCTISIRSTPPGPQDDAAR
jgi:hypothetical protein